MSCRRPNDHHRNVRGSEKSIPLVVEDYGCPETSDEDAPMTWLIMRGYPYKIWMCCKVPNKGRDPQVEARIVRFIKETGLTHFAYRSDREPAMTSMIDKACALSGRKGIKVAPEHDDIADNHGLQPGDVVTDGALRTDDLNASNTPYVESDLYSESTHTACSELSRPGESQSNGLAEKSVRDFID